MTGTILMLGHGYSAAALAARLGGWRVRGTTRSAERAAAMRAAGRRAGRLGGRGGCRCGDRRGRRAARLAAAGGRRRPGAGAAWARRWRRLRRDGSAISRPPASTATGRAAGSTRRARSRRSASAAAGGWRRRRPGRRPGCRCSSSGWRASTGRGGAPSTGCAKGRAQRVVKPGQVFSRIHVDDVGPGARGLARPARDPGRIYNVADDEPAPPGEVIAFAAGLLGLPVPPEVPLEAAGLSAMARSFWDEFEAGVEPAHPRGARRSSCSTPTTAPGCGRSSPPAAEGARPQRGKIGPCGTFRAGNRRALRPRMGAKP